MKLQQLLEGLSNQDMSIVIFKGGQIIIVAY